jgi:dienelactone hydrolase
MLGGVGTQERDCNAMDVERSTATLVSIPWRGHSIDALLHRPESGAEPCSGGLGVLRLHGLLGNLLDETEHFLPQRLASAGYASLTINTLLANLGLFFGFGIFSNTLDQIRAACEFLAGEGFRRIVIAGHGLGGCLAIRYAADPEAHPAGTEIVGIVAIATPYSMPKMVRRRWERFGSRPTYDEVLRRSERVCGRTSEPSPSGDEIVVVQRAHGDTSLPEHAEVYTLRTWWSLAGPEAHDAEPYRHIGNVRLPILLLQGRNDTVIESRRGEDLGEVARNAGNDAVTEVLLDGDHAFHGQHDALSHCIAGWLRGALPGRTPTRSEP